MDVSAKAVIRTFEAGDSDQILDLMTRSYTEGELGGFLPGEVEVLHGRIPIQPEGTIVAGLNGRIVGVTTPRHHFLIVDREHRRQGIGRRLAFRGNELSLSHDNAKMLLAPPQGSEVAISFLQGIGFKYHSSLWNLLLHANTPVPQPSFPPGYALRDYAESDLEAYVNLFNQAFVDHPTPLSLTVESARRVHALPDAVHTKITFLTSSAETATPVAFTRVRIVQDHEPRLGMINFIGVEPGSQRKGLGGRLLQWAIHDLRGQGCEEVTISVEAENPRALALYERTGFVRDLEWRRWAKID